MNINIIADMNIKCLLPLFNKGAYCVLTGYILIISFFQLGCEKPARENPAILQEPKANSEASLHVLRSHGPKLVNKLIASESYNESSRLEPLRSKVTNLISGYKAQNAIISASVYYMDFKTGDWFAINGSEGYTPGSLLKLPVCMSFFKLSEYKPDIMERQVFYDPNIHGVPSQTFEVDPIKPGKAYSMSELIRRVLKDSDNHSTSLINYQIDYDALKLLYRDLDQAVPDMHDISYTTNVLEYSRFLQILYNGTWLNEPNSERVLSYLSESSFKEGLTKQLPANIVVPRKFGEYGLNDVKQWHESGIVYAPDGHYLITIMTKGYDREKLRIIISEISKAVFDGR